MASQRVGVLGATGKTGQSIINGLLEAGHFSVVALTRPSSVSKPANRDLNERGVDIVAADLAGPEEALVAVLKGFDVVLSAISPQDQDKQIPLATAAKKAGVKRFVPCAYITIAPPGGVLVLRDYKELVYNHIKQLYLPYTIIDVGWWYQLGFPRLPSGKIDHALPKGVMSTLCGDGNTPSALTDLRDIGKYVAKIIADDRTLNKYVFAYNEVWTPNQVYAEFEELSGEKLPREYLSEAQIREAKESGAKAYKEDSSNIMALFKTATADYQLSWGIRGDNTPEYAKYLGYLTSKELYPDLAFNSFQNFLQEILDGKVQAVYEEV